MFVDRSGKIISDNDQYTASDGTVYPWNYPKESIPGLNRVTETQKPDANGVVVIGYHIDERHIQVWETRQESEEETKSRVNSAIFARLAENDSKIIRALTENDTARIDAHNAAQDALRAQLIK